MSYVVIHKSTNRNVATDEIIATYRSLIDAEIALIYYLHRYYYITERNKAQYYDNAGRLIMFTNEHDERFIKIKSIHTDVETFVIKRRVLTSVEKN